MSLVEADKQFSLRAGWRNRVHLLRVCAPMHNDYILWEQLGDCYALGVDVGSSLAMWKLGEIYRDGQPGVERDFDEAIEWFLCVANAGVTVAWGQVNELSKFVTFVGSCPAKYMKRCG